MQEIIRISEGKIQGTEIHFAFNVPLGVQKELRPGMMKTDYGIPISMVPKEIAAISAVGSLLAYAWYYGADIHVHQLDSTYAQNVRELRSMFDTKFPGQLRPSKLLVDEEVNSSDKTQRKGKGKGLLFSGGIDALSSYLEHKHNDLSLIYIVGAARGLTIQGKRERVGRLASFAGEAGIKLHLIKTNVRDLFNEKTIGDRLGKRYNRWWFLAFAPMFFGLAAPLAYKQNWGGVLLSSAPSPDLDYIRAGLAITDKYLGWSACKAETAGSTYGWYEKIVKFVGPHIQREGAKGRRFKHLYSCGLSPQACNVCDKCRSVIISLLSLGINPNKCGYICNTNTLQETKMYLKEMHGFRLTTVWWKCFRKDLQDYSPKPVKNGDMYGIGKFLSWLCSTR